MSAGGQFDKSPLFVHNVLAVRQILKSILRECRQWCAKSTHTAINQHSAASSQKRPLRQRRRATMSATQAEFSTKKNCHNGKNASKPYERLSCDRNHPVLFWYCPTGRSPQHVDSGTDGV